MVESAHSPNLNSIIDSNSVRDSSLGPYETIQDSSQSLARTDKKLSDYALSVVFSYLDDRKITQLQSLSKKFYYEITPSLLEKVPTRTKMEDLSKFTYFVQYYEGCLMVCNVKQYLEHRSNKLDWEALLPNPSTSDDIQKTMFYGRAIRVPGNRVFVISGSVSDKSTNNLTD